MNGKRTVYQAFLLRLWRETADAPWRYLLHGIPDGQQHGFASLESLFRYLDHVVYQDKEEMMAEHPNATLIKKAIEAFDQGNPGALMDLIAADAVFYVPGNSSIAGEYRGKEAIGGFFHHMGQLSGGSQRIDLKALLTGGDEHVVAIWNARGSREGIDYEGLAGWIFKMRGGQIVEARNVQEDQDDIDAFWSA